VRTEPTDTALTGLTQAEVVERVAAGRVNDVPAAPSRTVREIVRANVFTRFNALLGGHQASVGRATSAIVGGPGAGPSVTEEPPGGAPTATPAAGGTQLPPSGSQPDGGTGPTPLYVGLIVAGIVGLAALSAVMFIRRRRRAL